VAGTQTSGSFAALGGVAVVAVTDPAALEAAVLAVRGTVAAFDAACSSHRDDSELAEVNRGAGRAVRVGAVLLDAVQQALRAARRTGGAVDPTVGAALVAHGFYEAAIDGSRRTRLALASVPGHTTVAVDPGARTVRVGPGVRLDLGATGKALAADRAAQAAARAGRCGALVSLSGDLATCGPAPAGGWRIRVTDDHRAGPEAPGQWIALRGGALATSSAAARRRGVHHHLIDPATSRPAGVHFRTVSIAAASCLEANTLSTATIVRGASALEWLAATALPSRLVGVEGTVQHVAGWPAEGDDLEPAGLLGAA
jgi:FAD:protein FMN transferase